MLSSQELSILGAGGLCNDWMSRMKNEPTDSISRPNLSTHLDPVRCTDRVKSRFRRRIVSIQAIAGALVEAGFTSLDEQAKALGLRRSTTWTIIKTKHKLGRLNAKTAQRIFENPDTPPTVRAIIQQTFGERLDVAAMQSRDGNK